MMFELIPKIFIGMKAMITAAGMVMIGMMELGMCQRKMRMINDTMIISIKSSCSSVWIDSSISSERSYVSTSWTPFGSEGLISSRRAFTRSMTAFAFSP